ncbi:MULTISPECIES: hypothetical protein [Pseudomonas]|jgi:hypothetical protein|uniref:Uncharacterized protein n=1 Tax=Pseudomonas putida (strain ATCC 47054 / DSM 6125 / CFBP 8728 / NCIMB 11950 / KT2440) TaxID=160488 RepID=Q88IE7_PSEPK|nr:MULTISPECIES: hypothetical protein [Pseudomonas]AAN68660.1 conserved protein of unknown function [Pseudomonas putida KT2440]KMU97681.1 hypothetical protein AC138_00415 [Pseudomonas putida]KMY35304.1 hypothetical protein AA993_15585 [Pseudomonas putida]MDD2080902.1 hypothetical protein [Pseudomonas putida]PXZ53353.1 hypothetical protein DM483_04785 [Pseudomonas sp. SMT-1]
MADKKSVSTDETAASEAIDAPVVVAQAGAKASAQVTFADTVYTSRSLYLDKGEDLREFKVVAKRLSVPADDAEALAFLADHPELQRLDG